MAEQCCSEFARALSDLGVQERFHKLLDELCNGEAEFLRDIEEDDLKGKVDAEGGTIAAPVARGILRKLRAPAPTTSVAAVTTVPPPLFSAPPVVSETTVSRPFVAPVTVALQPPSPPPSVSSTTVSRPLVASVTLDPPPPPPAFESATSVAPKELESKSCSGCGQYRHHNAQCSEIQSLSDQWSAWLTGGRLEYHQRKRERAIRRSQAAALKAARSPKSRRWSDLSDGSDDEDELDETRDSEIYHAFVSCSLCKRSQSGILGPRFQCIHCRDFNVCLDCEPRLLESHNPIHIFRVKLESDFGCAAGMLLPEGTRVRISPLDGLGGVVGPLQHRYQWQDGRQRWFDFDADTNDAISTASARGQDIARVIIKDQAYDIDLKNMEQVNDLSGRRRPMRKVVESEAETDGENMQRVFLDAGGEVVVRAADLEPVVRSREGAERLLVQMLSRGG